MLKKPDWLTVPYKDDSSSEFVKNLLTELDLNTVCIEANCPNRSECFSEKTATFMILGNICTRNCSFCNVSYGKTDAIDSTEPQRVALAVKKLGLKYVVITSVTRDDLPDGGAEHFADVLDAVSTMTPDVKAELLIPDLKDIKSITDKSPAVIGHNIETVKSLYKAVRPEADYEKSLGVLKSIKELNPSIFSKSAIMLGLSETRDEILETFNDLRNAGCDFLTIGQYLSPGKTHYPVKEYITPEQFEDYSKIAKNMGFSHVLSKPFARSSYHAHLYGHI